VVQLKETAAEIEKTNEEVFRDREYQVIMWPVYSIHNKCTLEMHVELLLLLLLFYTLVVLCSYVILLLLFNM
jgi:hypothetical protein